MVVNSNIVIIKNAESVLMFIRQTFCIRRTQTLKIMRYFPLYPLYNEVRKDEGNKAMKKNDCVYCD